MKEHWSDSALNYLAENICGFPMNILSKIRNKVVKGILVLPAAITMTIMFLVALPIAMLLIFVSLTHDFVNNNDD